MNNNKLTQVKPSLATVLSQHKQVILAISRNSDLSYLNDNNSSEWDNNYLATITSQYSYKGAYIAFDCECLVKVVECGKVVIEQYDTSNEAYAIHCEGIGCIEDMSGYFYEIGSNDDFEILELEHQDRIVTDKPESMMVEWV